MGRSELILDIPLHIIHLSQDDPRKCTARKLERRGLAIVHGKINHAPKRGILLDPSAELILGPEDLQLVERGGALVALDCSWKKCDTSFEELKRASPNLKPRTLPVVLAANEVSWGRPGRLSTVEALAVSLKLLGRNEQVKTILSPFRFGEQFLSLNAEPLKAYAQAKSNEEIVQLQWEFFDRPDDD